MYKLFTFKYVILIHDKYFICLYDRYKKPFKPYNNMITDERPKLRRKRKERGIFKGSESIQKHKRCDEDRYIVKKSLGKVFVNKTLRKLIKVLSQRYKDKQV